MFFVESDKNLEDFDKRVLYKKGKNTGIVYYSFHSLKDQKEFIKEHGGVPLSFIPEWNESSQKIVKIKILKDALGLSLKESLKLVNNGFNLQDLIDKPIKGEKYGLTEE